MHRNYFEKSGDILIEIFRNKIMVSNPGGLVSWMKREDFGITSRPRNVLIANLLAKTIYVEKLGTGINRMRKAMSDMKLPKPEFRFNASFFITLYDKTFLEKITETVGKTVGKILTLINENPKITREEISAKTELTIRGVEWNLSKLKEEGLLKRIGPAKGGYWEIIN